jgi:hypothetical protein
MLPRPDSALGRLFACLSEWLSLAEFEEALADYFHGTRSAQELANYRAKRGTVTVEPARPFCPPQLPRSPRAPSAVSLSAARCQYERRDCHRRQPLPRSHCLAVGNARGEVGNAPETREEKEL